MNEKETLAAKNNFKIGELVSVEISQDIEILFPFLMEDLGIIISTDGCKCTCFFQKYNKAFTLDYFYLRKLWGVNE